MVVWQDLTLATWRCVHFIARGERQQLVAGLEATEQRLFEVAAGEIQTESEFFRSIASAMQFPDYFGANWDALDECLRDLDWLPATGYVLFVDNAEQFWHQATHVAGRVVESWLFSAEEWGRAGVPFHLVFVW